VFQQQCSMTFAVVASWNILVPMSGVRYSDLGQFMQLPCN